MFATLRTGPLGQAPFRWLVIGSTVNRLGDGIAPVALAFAVLDLGGTATELGGVIAVYALADVVAVLFGGVLGDRLPRRVMMEASNAGAALSQGIAAASLILGFGSIPLLAVAGAVNGALGALGGPSSRAMVQQTVPETLLAPAISWRRISENIALIVGNAVAGLLVVGFGSGWALAVDAVTFGLAAMSFAGIRVAPLPAPAPASMLSDLRGGLGEVLRHTWLWLLIGQALLYHLFWGGVLGVLGPIVVGDALGRQAWGYALAAMMAGFVLGGVVTLRWRPRRFLALGTAFLVLTACFPLAMALADSLPLLLLGAALHGFGLEIFSVAWDLSIQENVPPDKLARVFSIDMIGSFVARPLGLALTGPIAQAVGFRTWITVVGIVMAASSLVAATASDVRRLERVPDASVGVPEPVT
ncbi:MAG: MFS transporter [Marmoricola sp.]